MIIEKLPVVLLSTMAAEKSSSTNHQIASYILSHKDEVLSMGIQQLAEACYVGTGSISRFVRDIGLTGFNELRTLLQETDFTLDHAYMHEDPMERRNDLARSITDALVKAERSVDQKQLEKLCEDIHSYQNVYAFGLLKAESAAISLQSDLLMVNKAISTSAAYKEQIDTIIGAGKEDLILIFSYTGTYFSSYQFRGNEKRLLLPKIWMISGGKEKPPWFINETLSFDSEGKRETHPYTLELMASLIVQQYASMYQETAGE